MITTARRSATRSTPPLPPCDAAIPSRQPRGRTAQAAPAAAAALAAAFGTTRRLNRESAISVEAVRQSVPHKLIDTRVWTRFHGDELVVTAVDEDGSAGEVARHRRGRPGDPVLSDIH